MFLCPVPLDEFHHFCEDACCSNGLFIVRICLVNDNNISVILIFEIVPCIRLEVLVERH